EAGSLQWDDVSPRILKELEVKVHRVRWFSTYHVHHRVTSHFRRGRTFLLGDAAHVHSPVGGQGMNTGIGDAVNPAWQLTEGLSGRAGECVLDTYEPERIAFARRLVATTDRVFIFVSSAGPIARRVRMDVVPRLIPALLRTHAGQKFFFHLISQIGIRYRSCS